MAVRSLAEIMEEMRRYYKRYPKLQNKWRVLGGADEYGYNDLFFYGPGIGIWQMKTEQAKPYQLVGAGARIAARKIDDEIREIMETGAPMPFGFMSPHPSLRDRVNIAAGLGRYQETTSLLMEQLSSKERKIDDELRKKAAEIRRMLGLDIPYL
jgi:hypothetical protein